jgi:hypothetical protein
VGPPAAPVRRRLGLSLGAAILVAGLATWVAAADVRLPGFSEPSDPDVALPAPDTVPAGRGPTGPEREAALAPFVPGRFTCQPTGCELWRRPMTDWLLDPEPVAGMLAFLEAGELLAIDVWSGEVRWRTPLDRLLEAATQARSGWGAWGPQLGGDADRLAVATTSGVQVLTRHGEPLWAAEVDLGDQIHHVVVTPSSVGVASSAWPDAPLDADDATSEPDDDVMDHDWPEPPQQLTVFDARTGEPRWTRDDLRHTYGLRSSTADVFVVQARTSAEILDAATGDVRAAVDTGPAGWVIPFHDLLVVHVDDAEVEEEVAAVATSRIVDAADGTVRQEFEGYLFPLTVAGEVTILLRSTDGPRFGRADAPPDREAIAIGPEGEVRWRLELVVEDGDSCCPTVIDLGDGSVRVAAGPGFPAVVVDAATGAVRDGDPLAAALSDETQEHRQLGASTILRRTDDGLGALFDSTGRRVDLQGANWFPFWVDPGPDAPVLLHADGHLVAIDFP